MAATQWIHRRAAIARQAYESTLRRLARADTQVRLARLAG
jgi:hypothetical protein